MHVDPSNSIRSPHSAVSFTSETPKRNDQSKRDSETFSESVDVELQLSEEAASVPKHQCATKDEQANGNSVAPNDTHQVDDDRIDVTA
jgi:hypothetical protein